MRTGGVCGAQQTASGGQRRGEAVSAQVQRSLRDRKCLSREDGVEGSTREVWRGRPPADAAGRMWPGALCLSFQHARTAIEQRFCWIRVLRSNSGVMDQGGSGSRGRSSCIQGVSSKAREMKQGHLQVAARCQQVRPHNRGAAVGMQLDACDAQRCAPGTPVRYVFDDVSYCMSMAVGVRVVQADARQSRLCAACARRISGAGAGGGRKACRGHALPARQSIRPTETVKRTRGQGRRQRYPGRHPPAAHVSRPASLRARGSTRAWRCSRLWTLPAPKQGGTCQLQQQRLARRTACRGPGNE